MPILIVALVFVAATTLAAVALLGIFSEERSVARALKRVSSWEAQQASTAEPLLKPFRTRVFGPTGALLGRTFAAMMPANARVAMQHKLELAGDPGRLTPDGIVGLRIAGAAAGLLLGIVLVLLMHTGISLISVALFVGAIVLGFFAADLWLYELGAHRQDAIRRALPDMLDMLTISVQAGLGFDMALAKLVRTTSGPLSYEFARMLNEVQAGVARRDALRHMGERIAVPEVNNFVVAMVQADIFGVSVSGILREQSNEMRTRRRQRAEELAQKAPVKIVFPVIACILPATLLVILGPAVVSIGRAFGLLP